MQQDEVTSIHASSHAVPNSPLSVQSWTTPQSPRSLASVTTPKSHPQPRRPLSGSSTGGTSQGSPKSRPLTKAHLTPLPQSVVQSIQRAQVQSFSSSPLKQSDGGLSVRYAASASTLTISGSPSAASTPTEDHLTTISEKSPQRLSDYPLDSTELEASDSHGGRKYLLQHLHPDKKVGRQRRMSTRPPMAGTKQESPDKSSFTINPLYGAISDDGFNATYNQDVLCTLQNINDVPGTALFGMFDGHGRGGEEVAQLACDAIVKSLKEGIGSDPKNLTDDQMRDIFTKAFLHAQKLAEELGSQYLMSGATASVAFIDGTRLTVAHVGDSRVVLGRECIPCHHMISSEEKRLPNVPHENSMEDISTAHLNAIAITQDHRVGEMASERARVEANKGVVGQDPRLPPGEYDEMRIYAEGQAYPGLVTSRTIGDLMAHSLGVISDPDVTSKHLDEFDKILILATDGVWDIVSNQEAIELVSKYTNPTEATNQLVETCVKGWSHEFDAGDNVSAIVLYLNPISASNIEKSTCPMKWTWEEIREMKDQTRHQKEAHVSHHQIPSESPQPDERVSVPNIDQDEGPKPKDEKEPIQRNPPEDAPSRHCKMQGCLII